MKINLLIRFSTKYGQSLSITGNIPALGAHNLENPLPMSYLNENFWQASIDIDPDEYDSIRYRYIFNTETGEQILDGELERILPIKVGSKDVSVIDTWCYPGSYELAFFTSPFQKIFIKEPEGLKIAKLETYTHTFRVKAPLLTENECVCLLGSSKSLGRWQTVRPILLEKKRKLVASRC